MGCTQSAPVEKEGVTGTPDKSAPIDESTTGGKKDAPEKPKQQRSGSVVHKAPEYSSVEMGTPYDPAKIGTLTRHGIAPARMAGATSKAKINQDRGMVCWPFNGTHDQALMCVFDGHGMQGEKISEWCVQQIPQRLEADRATLNTDPHAALSKAIIAMDKDLLGHSTLGQIARGAGTTSNVLYFHGSKIYVACSGDSRAVLGRWKAGGKDKGKTNIEGVDLSRDHKPDLPEERKRIEAMKGVVSAAGPRGLPPSRVWVNGRVGLAMSRSIGDGEAKGHGVIPDPEIQEQTLTPPKDGASEGDAFVVVASDGIWEFISSQQAAEIIASHDTAIAACEELVKLAEQRWQDEEGSYRDDITCIIAFLPFLEARPDEDYTRPAGSGDGAIDDESILLEANGVGDASSPTGDTGDADKSEPNEFVKRRLSVASNIFDDSEVKA